MRSATAFSRWLALTTTLIVLGCGPDDRPAGRAAAGDEGGTLVISVAGDPDILLPPFIELATGNQVADAVYDRLAEPGMTLNTIGDEGFTPELAESWRWASDSLSIAFRLHPRARWHDGRPVRARDVQFTYLLYVDPRAASSVAPLLRSIDSVTVQDSLTAVFWFNHRHAEQFFDAAYQMRILPEHLLAPIDPAQLRSSPYARQPVGSGPFRFVRWDAGAALEIEADTSYHLGRAKLDRVIWSVSPEYQPAVAKVLAGEADFMEFLIPPVVEEARSRPDVRLHEYGSLNYGFLQFNLRGQSGRGAHPLFGDPAMRRALAMAVDRPRLVQSVFGDLARVSYGPFTRAQATADTTIEQIPYDTAVANRLLDSLGWRARDRSGVRVRNGRPLRFSIAFPTTSLVRRRLATLLQESFRAVGARVDLDAYDITQFRERLSSGRFDAAMNAWQTDPSPGAVRQTWGSHAASAGGLNYGKYESGPFDAALDSAVRDLHPASARRHWRTAYETIVAEAPAVFLFETVNYAAAHKRVHPVGMRADAWWIGLREWWIPAGERIARDRAVPPEAAP